MRLLFTAGDITSIKADAVVNAANEQLQAGGGVDGAIRAKAGPRLDVYLQNNYPSGCLTGNAVTTDCFDMQTCKYIFHAVGPKLRTKRCPSRYHEAQLCSAYLSVLDQAHSMQLHSLVFPLLSTGIYNYPMDRGFLIAVYTILSFLKAHVDTNLKTISIVFGSRDVMKDMMRYVTSNVLDVVSADDIEKELVLIKCFAADKGNPIILKRSNISIISFLRKFEDRADYRNVKQHFLSADSERLRTKRIRSNDEYRKAENMKTAERMRIQRQNTAKYTTQLISNAHRLATKRRNDAEFRDRDKNLRSNCMKIKRLNDPSYRLKENEYRNIRRNDISHKARTKKNIVLRVRRRLFSRSSSCAATTRSNLTSNFISHMLSRDRKRGHRQRALKKKFTPSTTTGLVQYSVRRLDGSSLISKVVSQLAVSVLLNRRHITKKQVDTVVNDIQSTIGKGLQIADKLQCLLEKEQKSLQKSIHMPNSIVSDKSLQIGGARLHVKSHEIEGAVGSYYPHQKYYYQKGVAPGFDSIIHATSSMSQESTASSNVNCDGDRHVEYIPQENETGRGSHDPSTSLTQPLCELSMDSTTSPADNVEIEQSRPMFDLHNPENIVNPTYAKTCDSSCILPNCDWPSTVETAMSTLLTKDIDVLMKSLVAIDCCTICSSTGLCPSIESCSNVKRLLLSLYSHCQNIRTILRRFYEIRRLCTWLYSWKKALRDGNLRQLMHIVKSNTTTSTEDASHNESAEHHSEGIVLEKYAKQLKEFHQRKEEYEIHACVCCTVLFSAKQVRRLSTDTAYLAPILAVNYHESEVIICQTCNTSLKKGTVPLLWSGNGLEIPAVPKELQDLNWLETLMIRQVRPIATTYLLNAQTGGRGIKQKGYKGTVLHMPMKIDQTVHRVLKELPSADNFNISVNIQNKQSARRLIDVDMGKVVLALEWLKANNSLYADVNISLDNPMDELWYKLFPGDPNMDNEMCELEKPVFDSNLLTLQEEHVSLAYVDAPAPKGLPSDKLFKMKHTKDLPAKSLDKDLDIMIFPELFPTGQFGMQFDRATHVSDTKFVRRNFRSKDRRFATNPDYCNFINNRQDWKTILGGIYISTKKCASGGEILRSLEDKNPAIDDMTNLVWSQLRSHQHYWAEKKKELRTMIQYLGPPTFFLTVNPAEYDWAELLSLYQAIYPGSTMSVNEFCVHDPAIFVIFLQTREGLL